MTWLPESATGATPIERAFGLRPDLFAACRDFAALFWQKRLVDPTLLELCRVRVGQMIGTELPALCEAMRDERASVPAAKVAGVGAWWNSAAFSDTERACLRFTEQFVAGALDEAGRHELLANFSPAEIVELGAGIALFLGFSKIALALGGLPDEIPVHEQPTPEVPAGH